MKQESLENCWDLLYLLYLLAVFVFFFFVFRFSLFAVRCGMDVTYERRSAYSNIQYTLVHYNNNNGYEHETITDM